MGNLQNCPSITPFNGLLDPGMSWLTHPDRLKYSPGQLLGQSSLRPWWVFWVLFMRTSGELARPLFAAWGWVWDGEAGLCTPGQHSFSLGKKGGRAWKQVMSPLIKTLLILCYRHPHFPQWSSTSWIHHEVPTQWPSCPICCMHAGNRCLVDMVFCQLWGLFLFLRSSF